MQPISMRHMLAGGSKIKVSVGGEKSLHTTLSAFDAQRAQALVELLTTGTIAQQFSQVVLISHYHAFDREAFRYHVRMEAGQIVESDLPEIEKHEVLLQTAL